MMSDHVRSKLCWSDIMSDKTLKIIMHTDTDYEVKVCQVDLTMIEH